MFNFRLEPSLSLGCGSWGGNAVSGNIGVEHLLNYKTVAERRENMLWFKVPPKVYFKRGATDLALRELQGKKRAFIVTDRFLFNSGAVDSIERILDEVVFIDKGKIALQSDTDELRKKENASIDEIFRRMFKC